MMTVINRRRLGRTFVRGAALCLLALAAVLLQSPEAQAQWTTSGTTTSTTNNVGIGTTAPEQPLHVNSGTVLSTGTYAGFSFRNRGSARSTDDWVWYSTGNVARFWRGTDLLGITNDGKLGIGTTSPATRLDVMGAANIWSGDRYAVTQGKMAPGTLTIGNAAANFGGGTGWNANTAGLMLEASDNTEIAVHDYGTRLASFMYYEGGATNRMTIGRDMGFGTVGTVSINGKVGVGTSDPTYLLDISGSTGTAFRVRDDAGREYFSTSSRTGPYGTSPVVSISGGRLIVDHNGPDGDNHTVIRRVVNGVIFNPSDHPTLPGAFMVRQVGGYYGLFVDQNTNGNVGVGTTAPGFKLDVQGGTVNASGGLCIAGDCKNSWSQVGGQWTTSGTNLLYNSGNVGIATQATPTAKLVIGGTAGAEGLDLATSDQYANLRVIRNSRSTHDKDLYLQYGAGAGSRIRFYTDNNETMTLVGGNLGVGTSAPAAKLHVTGDIRVDGNINAKYQDVAEWVPSAQKLDAGTVVILDPERTNHVLASKGSYDTAVAGVISEKPGLSLGEAGEGKVLVATTGRVKVRVDATRAPIKIGDLIVTSEVEGVAMKSEPFMVGGRRIHAPGTIIGKALEPLAGGTGEILVLLSLQ